MARSSYYSGRIFVFYFLKLFSTQEEVKPEPFLCAKMIFAASKVSVFGVILVQMWENTDQNTPNKDTFHAVFWCMSNLISIEGELYA